MLLYRDIISGDELISDAYNLKDVDDIVYEVDCAMVQIKQGEVDIGEEEITEDGVETVNNVVYSFRLVSTTYTKKDYQIHIKSYLKKLKQHLQENQPDRVDIFEKNVTAFVKKVLANFSEYDFYIGESMSVDGMVVLLNYREDGITPYMIFFKDGLREEKL
ncbi:hypothetical protein MERGE_003104 [Pneumocystis wakefieldiae]|uniref:Translationally-controlled tumor protein homolog n=1 Tax=Pneumocystis wakefieldiae TaxID=38082 RepID=A0A899GBK5_9ASCO|nr:hypothetical protein MERGE_003104 [Pneumocystis wakefieldiae]